MKLLGISCRFCRIYINIIEYIFTNINKTYLKICLSIIKVALNNHLLKVSPTNVL